MTTLTAVMEENASGYAPDNPLAGKRILVADDHAINQKIAVCMLEMLGCVVEVASDGREAVDMHRAAPYALILMDCQMPGLDGYQATMQIRALEDCAAAYTPVIALTACNAPDEQERCTASGMDDFISKPIRPQTLKDTLTRWLHPRARPATTAIPPRPHGDELEAVRAAFGADFADLARLYQTDSPRRIARLHRACATADSECMIKVAHALSGSSASIGALTLSTLCRDLETWAKAGALDDFAQRMAAIEAEYARVSARLRSMLMTGDETTQ